MDRWGLFFPYLQYLLALRVWKGDDVDHCITELSVLILALYTALIEKIKRPCNSGVFLGFCSAPAEIPETSIKLFCPWLSPPLSFLLEFHGRGFVTVAGQVVVGALHPAGRLLHFKWLIYRSLGMWEVIENQWSIWAQRQFMLTLHCRLLIFMQMFQIECVSIKPYAVSCIGKKS